MVAFSTSEDMCVSLVELLVVNSDSCIQQEMCVPLVELLVVNSDGCIQHKRGNVRAQFW